MIPLLFGRDPALDLQEYQADRRKCACACSFAGGRFFTLLLQDYERKVGRRAISLK
jgi:hypothetical protein